jgi:hypothetical protein
MPSVIAGRRNGGIVISSSGGGLALFLDGVDDARD